MNKLCLLLLVFITITQSAFAETPDYCNPTFDDGADLYFADSVGAAKDALSEICGALANDGTTKQQLNATLTLFHEALQKDASKVMTELNGFLFIFDSPLLEVDGDIATGMIPDFIVHKPDPLNPNLVDKITFYYQGKGPTMAEDVPKKQAQDCIDNDQCSEALIAYMDIIKSVYNPLAATPIKLAFDFLTLRDKQWTNYIKEARSQTFIDIAVTSILYEWKYGKDEHNFRSPPRVQWFALRPNVLIENVSSAVDGDQVKESLALEVIGFNYWQDQCFGYACGASLIVNYSDRNGVDDKGWGVMFHVENSYSFGLTKHSGETGFFVTVDLLKVFQNKKSSFDEYNDKYRKLAR